MFFLSIYSLSAEYLAPNLGNVGSQKTERIPGSPKTYLRNNGVLSLLALIAHFCQT